MARKRTAILVSMLFAALTLAVFLTLPGTVAPVKAQQTDSIQRIDLTQMEADFVAREAVYRQQILELDALLKERQATYGQQVETLTQALAVGRSQLTALEAQQVAAEQQVAQLNSARDERQSLFLTRRQENQYSYDVRYTQMLTQLADVQAKLAEAQQILGQ
jgi:type IV secretory pathway protease TraF